MYKEALPTKKVGFACYRYIQSIQYPNCHDEGPYVRNPKGSPEPGSSLGACLPLDRGCSTSWPLRELGLGFRSEGLEGLGLRV